MSQGHSRTRVHGDWQAEGEDISEVPRAQAIGEGGLARPNLCRAEPMYPCVRAMSESVPEINAHAAQAAFMMNDLSRDPNEI